MLKINLELGTESDVNRVIGKYQAQMVAEPSALASLVKSERHALAARMIRNQWSRVDTNRQSTLVQYDEALDQALPVFLQEIQREDLKYFAEVLLKNLADPAGDESDPAGRRDARLKELAQRLDQVEFVAPALKEQTLMLLSQGKESAMLVAEPLAEMAKTINVVALLEVNDRQLKQRRQALLAKYLDASLKSGDPEPMTEALDKIVKAEIEQPYYKRELIQQISGAVEQTVHAHWLEWKPEQIEAMLPITRQLAGPPTNMHIYERDAYNAANFLGHILADKEKELKAWWDQLSDEQREEHNRFGVHRELWEMTAKIPPGQVQTCPMWSAGLTTFHSHLCP